MASNELDLLGMCILGVIAILGIPIGYRDWRARLARAEARAGELGLRWEPRAHTARRMNLGRFGTLPSRGNRRLVTGLVGEVHGVPYVVSRCSFVAWVAKRARSHVVCAFKVPDAGLPSCSVVPERAGHVVGAWLGFDDIDIAEDPAFSGAFFLQGADEAAVRALFGPVVRRVLCRHPDWCVEVRDGVVLVVGPDMALDVDRMVAFVEQATMVLLALLQAPVGVRPAEG